MPQILKIVRASSAEGLSYVAIILELLAVSFTCTYNYGKGFNFRYSNVHRHESVLTFKGLIAMNCGVTGVGVKRYL